MKHREKLLQINKRLLTDRPKLPSKVEKELKKFQKIIENQKGLFTVLITLGIHKILFPEQDVRKHQKGMSGGFSGRTIDTKFITPTLRELGYPSMKESGWLTRSIEQPHPFDKNFPGHIKTGKEIFLNLVHFIEQGKNTEDIVLCILGYLKELKEKNKIELVPLKNPENITIKNVTDGLKQLIKTKYRSSGGSKLPVLIIYSMLKVFCKEVDRYKNCQLNVLGSHLSPDSRSGSSGDVEIIKQGSLFESYEIKLDVVITNHIINRVKDKIFLHNPKRYFIISSEIDKNDRYKIKENISKVQTEHGCQIFIEDPLELIERYIRVISEVNDFLNILSDMIINDEELKIEHKEMWKKIYNELQ